MEDREFLLAESETVLNIVRYCLQLQAMGHDVSCAVNPGEFFFAMRNPVEMVFKLSSRMTEDEAKEVIEKLDELEVYMKGENENGKQQN